MSCEGYEAEAKREEGMRVTIPPEVVSEQEIEARKQMCEMMIRSESK